LFAGGIYLSVARLRFAGFRPNQACSWTVPFLEVMDRDQKILLVDDEPIVTRTLIRYLENAGFRHVRAVNDPLAVEG
jgi:PleD family two-component response regulator